MIQSRCVTFAKAMTYVYTIIRVSAWPLTLGQREIRAQDPSPDYPELSVEPSLVLVYDSDHILYVSPKLPELHAILTCALVQAEQSGLIAAIAYTHFHTVFQPPINLHTRRVIRLEVDEPAMARDPLANR